MADDDFDLQDVLEPVAPEPQQIDVATELQAVKKSMDELIQATKLAQGQARRAEQIALAAQTAVHPKAASEDPIEAYIDKLDDNDPATRLIKTALKTQQQELKGLKQKFVEVDNQNVRQAMSQKEVADRAYSGSELIAFAEAAGVDIRLVAREIDALPTALMYHSGKEIIMREKTKAKRAPSDTTEPVVSGETKYTETRRSPGARPKTWVETEQAYADGNISTEQYTAALRARKE